jgi:molybdopterin molybdotransferase
VAALLSVEEAQRLILERAHALEPEDVELARAAGRVTADACRAQVDLPPFPSSAMDGFAVRTADLPGTLPVTGRVAAGRPASTALAPASAMGIATGGVVPEGADAVVPIEYVVENDNTVEIDEAPEAGSNVRPRGGDVRRGEVVVEAGVRLGPAQIGALAAAGVAVVRCGRQPRVAVLSTGTELARPGQALEAGQVYEANSTLLAAAVRASGGVAEPLAAVSDEEDEHRRAVERGLAGDVLVTSGGVSVGPHDLVRRVEAGLGVEEVFWRVSVKPGKPVAFGVRGQTLVFGLPGNPVSALVGFELFVKPALLKLQGLRDPLPRLEPGRLTRALERNPSRDEFVRARSRLDRDGVELEPVSGQDSHMIARAAAADVLVHVPPGEGELPAGETVRFLRLTASL